MRYASIYSISATPTFYHASNLLVHSTLADSVTHLDLFSPSRSRRLLSNSSVLFLQQSKLSFCSTLAKPREVSI